MRARALMVQGTGSDVGKSLIVAALCRIARRRGIRVAPFKPQNMSNNAAACAGGEIGRAQALQARAAGLEPEVDFNPVLLKPETDRRAQVIVRGKVIDSMEAADYMARRGARMDAVLASFERLANAYELIVVEGAGSPAEVNLREGDIANMGFARRVGIPVCLVGDIDKGGVIASLAGTQAVLSPQDAAMIRGFVINKFRGDPSLFDDGVRAIEEHTGWRSFGVVPWLACAADLPAEDAVVLNGGRHHAGDDLRIVAPMLSRLANFDDADPLRLEPGVDFRWIPPGRPLPRDTDVVILFGTKSTLGDLRFLRSQGWDHDILAHARTGGRVLGLCGGYQMLGSRIEDAEGVDGRPGQEPGLGLLDVHTEMSGSKAVRPVEGRCVSTGLPVTGYEIHVGRTTGKDCVRPMFDLGGRADGARSTDGLIEGSYVHGVFTEDEFRRDWLRRAGAAGRSSLDYGAAVEAALVAWADGVERAVDVDALLACAVSPSFQRADSS
ncbi:MAG: cobyric acid synthase [Proteobacteria bacterium]|nr:cobyric acid synthase [Pseudomonadota bacterium]MYJ95546.1 cobyric acid synthase [Pseudomonadota bacterium]